VLSTDAGLVGHARAVGAKHTIAAGARWIACTDADSVVGADRLSAQLALGADAVCGAVTVDDWTSQTRSIRRRYQASDVNADGHRHVHGANLGVATHAYLAAGGFLPLGFDEDVALVCALMATGASIAWSAAPGVRTSARMLSRPPRGFGHYLRWRRRDRISSGSSYWPFGNL